MDNFTNKMIIKKNHKRHKEIKLPVDLNTFLQTQNLSNWQGRIIYSILNLIKDQQFSDGNSEEGAKQLEIFKMYWNDDSSTVTFNFHFSDFVPIGVQYKRDQIEAALKGLITIGLSEQQEIIDGKLKKRFTGIIFNPIWDPKAHNCSFQMTSSWFKLFMIAVPYQTWLLEETLLLSARARKFLLFLNQYEYLGGFWKYRKDLCSFFGVALIPKSQIEQNFLFPLREELDNKGELSFNYKYDTKKDQFIFTIYRLKNAKADKIVPGEISMINSLLYSNTKRDIVNDKKIATNAAIKYIIKARNLNTEEKDIFFKICLKYGYNEVKGSIKNTTKNNMENSFKNLKGKDFLDKILQKFPL